MSDVLRGIFTVSNPGFSSLAFCSAALSIKVFGVALMTSRARGANNAFANPEDANFFGKGAVKSNSEVDTTNQNVERVRRIHANDLENIPIFILLGLLYLATKPDTNTAIWHFRAFTIARFAHTICYKFAIPQPSRATAYVCGLVPAISMAVQILRSSTF